MAAWEKRKRLAPSRVFYEPCLSPPRPTIPGWVPATLNHTGPEPRGTLGQKRVVCEDEVTGETEKQSSYSTTIPFPSGSHGNKQTSDPQNRVKIALCPVSLQSVSIGTGREGDGGWVAGVPVNLCSRQVSCTWWLARWSSGLQASRALQEWHVHSGMEA